MSNAAKFEVPGSGDDGKAYTYNEVGDAFALTDMASQAELDAHLNDVAAAHAASAISFTPGGTIAGTTVQTAVAEVATDAATALTTHGNLTTSVHGIADTSALLDTADIGVSVQGYSSVLAATTASFTTADETKLDGIEALADVTDETNVVAALSGATLTDLGTPASGDKILLLDASDSDNLKVAQFSTFGGGGSGELSFQETTTGSGYWQYSPYLSTPTGTAWAIINRAQVSPNFFEKEVDITALAVNVAVAGAASNVIRLGIYSAGSNGLPATVLAQGTVAGDSTGYKTLTLGAPVTLSGFFWLVAAPQGSGNPGSTWLTSITRGLLSQFDETGASYAGTSVLNWSAYFASSGAFTDNPTLTQESNARVPYIPVRIT